ncbi:hypothetical protein [Bradyrhizobium canariense]|uniref:hypothetical protein n=1 Tax=Bradyrhizobium canariense TaxID=255045 RepID=UPI0011781F17|nr:hypothetical protein [Bradyrhizobium canariense]
MTLLISTGQIAEMKSVVNPLKVSRFLRGYDEAAAQKGIKLSIGFDFHEYVSITKTLPTKTPTYPSFRPDRSPIRSGEGYWMIGLDKNNEVALVQAARLYDLSNSNFAEHLESLKVFYSDPATQAHPQDRCSCTAPSAKKIDGKVAYHGDFWLRKDFRGQGMPEIMAAVLRGVSFAMWAPDFVVGLPERWLLSKGVLAQYGHLHCEPGGSVLHLIEEGIVADDLLVWLTGNELQCLVDRKHRNELPLAK